MAKPENVFRRLRRECFRGWEATCTEGNAMSLQQGEPYTVRLDRPMRPSALPSYESIDGPAIKRTLDKLAEQGWEYSLIHDEAYDPTLQRKTSTLSAVLLRHPGKAQPR